MCSRPRPEQADEEEGQEEWTKSYTKDGIEGVAAPDHSGSLKADNEEAQDSPPVDVIHCPKCTYANVPSAEECEMCENELKAKPAEGTEGFPANPIVSVRDVQEASQPVRIQDSTSSVESPQKNGMDAAEMMANGIECPNCTLYNESPGEACEVCENPLPKRNGDPPPEQEQGPPRAKRGRPRKVVRPKVETAEVATQVPPPAPPPATDDDACEKIQCGRCTLLNKVTEDKCTACGTAFKGKASKRKIVIVDVGEQPSHDTASRRLGPISPALSPSLFSFQNRRLCDYNIVLITILIIIIIIIINLLLLPPSSLLLSCFFFSKLQLLPNVYS